MDVVTTYIMELCELLGIDVPEISFDTSAFKSKTMMAQYQCGTLHLKTPDGSPDCFFAIAHELRHAWQIVQDEHYYFADYKTVDSIGVEAYNNQIAEIDANAFAMVMLSVYFGIKPLFNGLSSETVARIKQYTAVVVKQLNS